MHEHSKLKCGLRLAPQLKIYIVPDITTTVLATARKRSGIRK